MTDDLIGSLRLPFMLMAGYLGLVVMIKFDGWIKRRGADDD